MSEFFTSQTAVDRDTILDTCKSAVRDGKLSFLEIGVFGGSTARGIKHWCDENGIALDYTGIDNGSHPSFNDSFKPTVPFDGARLVIGDSVEVFPFVIRMFGYSVIFCDGCHCGNHVILETVIYSKFVRDGGFFMFHDCNPEISQTMRDPHGPNIPWFHNSVLQAHQELGWPWKGWKLVADKYDPEAKFGGCRVYQKAL